MKLVAEANRNRQN